MSGILNAFVGGSYGAPPGAPTATGSNAISCSQVLIYFNPPSSTGGSPILYYTGKSSPGCITTTGASSPITMACLNAGTCYTFTVTATNAIGTGPASGATPLARTFCKTGSTSYTTPGTYSWVAPVGVSSVSVVAVGGGSGGYCHAGYGAGGGGGLGYKNTISVTAGNSYTVVVGAGGTGGSNNCNRIGKGSYFIGSCLVAGIAPAQSNCGGRYQGTGGGNGGPGAPSCGTSSRGGGGAGGYSGNGGGGSSVSGGNNGSGGGGGGGGGGCCCASSSSNFGNGGGVGLFGQGSNGAGGSPLSGGGGGGSGGCAGGNKFGTPGLYGGGAGSKYSTSGAVNISGANGAVRIVYPGSVRKFPSTCVGTP